jgi:hypothetical protein
MLGSQVLDILKRGVHHLDARLEGVNLVAHLLQQTYNLAVHRQPIVDSLLNDRNHPLDCRDVVLLFSLIALYPLGEPTRIVKVHSRFETLL